ncbi:MAG: hypothetical protein M5R38_07085 [Candidatus Methylomirabilis sp.]|nr:hypothetical protein [Candidatus Methylomirabilis sp.]
MRGIRRVPRSRRYGPGGVEAADGSPDSRMAIAEPLFGPTNVWMYRPTSPERVPRFV